MLVRIDKRKKIGEWIETWSDGKTGGTLPPISGIDQELGGGLTRRTGVLSSHRCPRRRHYRLPSKPVWCHSKRPQTSGGLRKKKKPRKRKRESLKEREEVHKEEESTLLKKQFFTAKQTLQGKTKATPFVPSFSLQHTYVYLSVPLTTSSQRCSPAGCRLFFSSFSL